MAEADPDPHRLDRRAARRAFSAASHTYDQVAVLQAEVRTQLLERLQLIALQPLTVLDLGCGTAAGAQMLQRQYGKARVIAMDAAFGMLEQAATHSTLLKKLLRKDFARVCADAYHLPLRTASVDLVFSNLMLQWCDPPDAVFAEVRRVLKPGGVVVFSSFGPDTLRELRAAWATVDQHTHVNRFIDMHDLGDAMMRAGLAEPVLDVDRLTLTYGEVLGLMRELKAIGAHNVTVGRPVGLTGRDALQRLTHAYEAQRRNGVLPATYEVVYGQAWGSEQPLRGAVGEVYIPLNRIGRRR